MSAIDGLNEAQRAAALDTEGAVLVTAGAGSGKTRLLTRRIAHLVEDMGVPPYNILAITFTNKAADEMKNRVAAIVSGAADVWISTFHSMCARILRRHATRLGYASNFTIYATDETERTVKQIVKDMGIDGDSFYKTALRCISDAKNDGLSPEDYGTEFAYLPEIRNIVRVYSAYEEKLHACNAMDFDDLLLKTHELFEKCPDVLLTYSGRFRYILVDEFQDTNVIQYGLVRMLAQSYGNVFVVGDEDQSIYGWRGADVTNMQNFIEDFGAKIYKLEQNYRSTGNILRAANNLIGHNVSRIQKQLWSDKGEGQPVVAYMANTEADEADFVVNTINKLIRDGARPHDFAVLMRVNALTRLLEQRFMQYNLPYKVYGGFKFFDRKEVKDILAYMRLLANPADDEAVQRIINFPKRGIGDGTVRQLIEYASSRKESLVAALTEADPDLPAGTVKKLRPFTTLIETLRSDMQRMSVSELVERIIFLTGIKDVYAEESEDNTARRLNIEDFVSSVHEFEKNRGGTLSDFLEEVTLYTEGDEDSGDAVFLSTVHSAKGMEFRNVFVIGVEEGLFPLGRAAEDVSELEEERRLMYVAVTRAQERLYLTYCASRFMYGERKMCRQSRFLDEIDPSLAPKTRRRMDGNGAPSRSYKPGGGYGSERSYSARSEGAPRSGLGTRQGTDNIAADYTVGTRVVHKKFGEGVVEGVTNVGANSYVVINFDTVGKITLSLAFAPIRKL